MAIFNWSAHTQRIGNIGNIIRNFIVTLLNVLKFGKSSSILTFYEFLGC
jgi:hypothetical protein